VRTDNWYLASAHDRPEATRLEGMHSTDVCVLGAGFTGLSTAIALAERGYSVRVLEAGRVGQGASGRSGGQMLTGFGCEMDVIEKHLGLEGARACWKTSVEAVALVLSRISRFNIDCDLVRGHIHTAVRPRQVDGLRQWMEQLTSRYDYPLDFLDQAQIREAVASERYLAGVHDPFSGHLHPLNYCLGLAEAARSLGVVIHENSPVLRLERGTPVALFTDRGQVRADHVVLAGNAYLNGLMPAIERRIMPAGTYILATEPLGAERARQLIRDNAAIADVCFVLDYFRLSADHRLLFGGKVSYSTLPPANLRAAMRRDMLRVFPQLADVGIEYAWGGHVAITMNRAPDLGRIGPNIWYGQGFSGHGVALTGIAGEILAEAIHGDARRLDLFSRIPHRPFPGGKWLRMPLLVLAMAWYRMRDLLG
jgi:gamma-glutamylputrescine oxidase